MRGLGCFQAACEQFSVDAGLEAICGKLSDVSRTRQASGFLGNFKGSSGESLGFFMHIRGHLQAFSAGIIATGRQVMHLSNNMFRQRKIRELSGTFCGQFEAILQAFSVSLGVSCQSSGILRTTFHLLGCCVAILSTTGLGVSKQEGTRGCSVIKLIQLEKRCCNKGCGVIAN